MPRIVAISDSHGHHEALELPAGDVLVHAGDFSLHGVELEEARGFLEWFASRPHPHKVLVLGNHELSAEREPARFRALVPPSVHLLHDSGATVAGLRFWGAPWTPIFFDWAFMLPRGPMLREKWDLIPTGIDVLVTHGPPYGHGDGAPPRMSRHWKAVGCLELLQAVRRVRPRLHVFGHIHAGYGLSESDEAPGTVFANAAVCTESYAPTNPPLVVTLR